MHICFSIVFSLTMFWSSLNVVCIEMGCLENRSSSATMIALLLQPWFMPTLHWVASGIIKCGLVLHLIQIPPNTPLFQFTFENWPLFMWCWFPPVCRMLFFPSPSLWFSSICHLFSALFGMFSFPNLPPLFVSIHPCFACESMIDCFIMFSPIFVCFFGALGCLRGAIGAQTDETPTYGPFVCEIWRVTKLGPSWLPSCLVDPRRRCQFFFLRSFRVWTLWLVGWRNNAN